MKYFVFLFLLLNNQIFAQEELPTVKRYNFSKWEKTINDEEKEKMIQKLKRIKTYEENMRDFPGQFMSNTTITDFNRDGQNDIIYFGYLSGSESEYIILFQAKDNDFIEVLNVAGYPIYVSEPSLLKKMELIIKNYPCCAEIVSVIETYAPIEINGEFKYILKTKYSYLDLEKSIFPKIYFDNPIQFKTINDKYSLRFRPEIDDTTEYIYDFKGNISAIYPKGSLGVAIAGTEDNTGRIWWFVYMKNNLIPLSNNLNKGSNNDFPYYSYGWISKRYIEIIK
jgi:hypothetical protein